ncbi:hypothetical protein HZH66_004258 [Vespula vulgaris]|uniref:Uncharacterized protein n=1 Tax=Vespula vulgaris TaxID=7454 RepID=A0A834KEV9_VESVU|nr:hypothetical protein HZH66_004258 [Vespula vulgaris]
MVQQHPRGPLRDGKFSRRGAERAKRRHASRSDAKDSQETIESSHLVITAITSDNIIGSHQGSSSQHNDDDDDDDDNDDDDDDDDEDDEDDEDDDKDDNRARVHGILELSRRGIRQDHPWWNSRMTEKRNYRNYLGMPRPKKKNKKKNKNKKKKKKSRLSFLSTVE